MNSKHVAAVRLGIFKRALVLFSMTLLALALAPNLTAQSSTRGQLGPEFDKAFVPATIGPGSTATLRFDIINNDRPDSVGDLAFTDNLPASVTIAAPAQGLSDCGGTLSAPDGGATISLTGGGVAAGATCSIFVNVTSSSPGTHTNTSGDLTSSAGNSGPATADLNVVTTLPGFTKTFSPASAPLGSRSTLTFTIDNTGNASAVANLDFTDQFPTGMVIASPANSSTTCGTQIIPATLTAVPGTDVVTLDANGVGSFPAVPAGSTCSVTLDVVSEGIGALENLSGELLADFVSAGRAGATLSSTAGEIVLVKEFLADPVPPGGTVDLEFTILNRTRADQAIDIAFTDDLGAALAGLTAVGLPAPVCGGTLTGTTDLSFTGGSVPPASECAFTVSLQVPAGTAQGIYPNTTSTISADLGGSEPVLGNAAADDLFVFAAPVLEKTFLDDPAAAGGSTRMEFTITNSSSTSAATDIAFIDELTTFLPFPVSATLPANGFCGPASSMALIFPGGDRQGLSMTDGELAPGASCTFEVTLDLPAGLPGGIYTNTTDEITATVADDTTTGNPATADFTVVAPPVLTKTFTDDPVQPGDTVTLEFTLEHDDLAPTDATDIAFTDDLGAALTGLTGTGLPIDDVCGAGSEIAGTSTLSFTGGTLAPGASCTFSVTLEVPAGAPSGEFTNTTSSVTANVSGLAATGLPAEDTLTVAAIRFSKEFIDDPALPGGQATLRFSIENLDASANATNIFFTDDVDANLAGLAASGLPQNDICGTGSSIQGTNFLIFSGGNLVAGTSCTFDVVLDVPLAAAIDTYGNVTSNLSGSLDGNGFVLPPATDNLVVENNLLTLSKSFTDDPVDPGGTVTLEFTVANLNATDAASDISFTDDLDAALSGLAAIGLPASDVCGTGSQISGTSLLTLTGGNLPAGGSCTFSVTVQVPAAVSLGSTASNVTSDVTGTITGVPVQGAPARDILRIRNIRFTKSFDGPSTATGSPVLTFTLTNLSTTDTVSGLDFLDDLDAALPGLLATGLPTTNVCGAGSQISGTSTLNFTGGALGPGETCTFDVDLLVPVDASPGGYLNTTSELLASGLSAASPASATLQIEPPPAFSKVFSPNAISVGGTSTLTFSINNTASAVAANSLSFSDSLPAGLEVAGTPNASTTCTGGTLTASAGSGTISYTGGQVAAGASCTLAVDVTGTSEGEFVNTSNALTSSSGNSGTATDTIDVVAGDFVVTKSFRTEPVLPGGMVELELSIVNGSAFALTDVSLTDDLSAALSGLAAEGLPLTDVCGAGSQVTGTSVVALTGGNLAAGASCTVVVPVRVPSDAPEATFVNTTSTANGIREGVAVTADPDDANLVVERLSFTKAFSPILVPVGGSTTATFEITNPDPANAVDGLTFTDDLEAFVPGMTATGTPISDACGAGSTISGTSIITLTDGSIAPGASCTIQVVLTVPTDATAADVTNTTSELTGLVSGNQTSSAPASALLAIQPLPAFGKAFSPGAIVVGEASTLTFSIDNGGSQLAADSLAFDDSLPSGLTVADPANVTNSCGGSVSALPGAGTIGFTGGSIAAGSDCTIQVAITGDTEGTFSNTTEPLTSSVGDSGTASDALDVVSGEFTVTKAFLSQPVLPGALVDLEFSITNDSSFPLADIALTDDLSAALAGLAAEGLPLADVCGAGSQVDGGAVASLTNGTLDPNASCTFVVQVRVPSNASAGSFVNTTDPATATRQGVAVAAGSASADLVVEPLGFTKAFDPLLVTAGGTITATFEITNPDPANPVAGLTFFDDLDAFVPGMTAAGTPINDACGSGSLLDGTSTITLTNGTVAAGGSCTIQVVLEVPTDAAAGDFTNITSPLDGAAGSSQTDAAPASAVLAVQPPPAFAKAFSPDAILVGEVSTLTFVIDNSASQLNADMLTFDDNLPSGMSVATSPAASNTCGGTLVANPGTDLIRLTGGSLAAGSICQITVDVVATISGTLTNVTDDLTFDPGTSGNATAVLTVGQAIPVPLFNATWLALLALMLAALGWNALNTRKL